MARLKPNVKCKECTDGVGNPEGSVCSNVNPMHLMAVLYGYKGKEILKVNHCSEAEPAVIGNCGECFWRTEKHGLCNYDCVRSEEFYPNSDAEGCSKWWPRDEETMDAVMKEVERDGC
jgi:hypothetical protein